MSVFKPESLWCHPLGRVTRVRRQREQRTISPCARLLKCLPALQHDPNRPEVVLKVDADDEGVGGDGAADALRYLVATKLQTVGERKLTGF